jgi:hypothetical protein
MGRGGNLCVLSDEYEFSYVEMGGDLYQVNIVVSFPFRGKTKLEERKSTALTFLSSESPPHFHTQFTFTGGRAKVFILQGPGVVYLKSHTVSKFQAWASHIPSQPQNPSFMQVRL